MPTTTPATCLPVAAAAPIAASPEGFMRGRTVADTFLGTS
jgi:hypothetical protein